MTKIILFEQFMLEKLSNEDKILTFLINAFDDYQVDKDLVSLNLALDYAKIAINLNLNRI